MASLRLVSWLMLGCAALGCFAACNQVLGIEGAAVDPRLSAAGAGATLPGAGTGALDGSSGAQGGFGANSPTTGGSSPTAGAGGSGHDHSGAGGPSSAGGDAGEGSVAGSGTGGTGGGAGGTTGGTTTHAGHDSGNGSSGEGGGAGDTTGTPVDACDEYCDLMVGECEGEALQYRDRDQCLKICHLLPAGTAGSTEDENSVACRLKYAKKTKYNNGTEVTIYCREAGPSGDGRCGSVCEGFCSLMNRVCTEASADSYHFESDEDCLATCGALPEATIPYSSSDPQVSDGNHALCRLFHVTSAAMADADEHCEHAMGVTLCQASP